MSNQKKRRARRDIFEMLEQEADLYQGDLAEIMGVDGNTVRRWVAGEMRQSPMAKAFLRLLLRLHREGLDVRELVTHDELRTRNGYELPEAPW